MAENLISQDLAQILSTTRPLWNEIRGKKIFITGGTGFFGTWLLKSLCYVNDQLDLGIQAVVLSRNPECFLKKCPELENDRGLRFLQGDVLSLGAPDESFDFCIHAATPADAKMNLDYPLLMLDTIVSGTRRVLEFAKGAGVKKFLLASSGAVYGRQPSEISRVSEAYIGSPDPMNHASAYGEGKRVAEHLCVLFSRDSLMETKVARCFAFVGPYLPLDAGYAVGNFIRDSLNGKRIFIAGDGTPLRSYLYASDLIVWLWTILFRGVSGRAYNVGSEDWVSIQQVAECVSSAFRPELISINIAKAATHGIPAERYIPSTARARDELGLRQQVSFDSGLRKTVKWHRARSMHVAFPKIDTLLFDH